MREPHKQDEPTAYRDPGPTLTTDRTPSPAPQATEAKSALAQDVVDAIHNSVSYADDRAIVERALATAREQARAIALDESEQVVREAVMEYQNDLIVHFEKAKTVDLAELLAAAIRARKDNPHG